MMLPVSRVQWFSRVWLTTLKRTQYSVCARGSSVSGISCAGSGTASCALTGSLVVNSASRIFRKYSRVSEISTVSAQALPATSSAINSRARLRIVRFRWGGMQGKLDMESAATSGPGFDADGTAQACSQQRRDGQPQAAAFDGFQLHFLRPRVGHEQRVADVVRNAVTGVDDIDAAVLAVFFVQLQQFHRDAAFVGVLDGVDQQVGQDLGEAHRVGVQYQRPLVESRDQGEALVGAIVLQVLAEVGQQWLHRYFRLMDFQLAGFNP